MRSVNKLALILALALMAIGLTAVSAYATTVTPVDPTNNTGSFTAVSDDATLGAGFAVVTCDSTTAATYQEDGTGTITNLTFTGCTDSLGRTCVAPIDANDINTGTLSAAKVTATGGAGKDFVLTLADSASITGNVTCTGIISESICTYNGDTTVQTDTTAGNGDATQTTSGTVAGTTEGAAQSTSATAKFDTAFTLIETTTGPCSDPANWTAYYTVRTVTAGTAGAGTSITVDP